MNDIKKIDAAEFRRAGYLQEVNRCFLHPLGLALEVVVEDDGTERFGDVWDYRDDPEGMAFGPGMIDEEKARAIENDRAALAASRSERLGYVVQPVPASDQNNEPEEGQ